jgi:DNA-binding transcriptional ArsR family regulator
MTAMMKKSRKLGEAIGLLKMLAHPVRLSILCNLLHQGEMSVGQIVESEEGVASQSQISQFLAGMRRDNLVISRKEAQTVYYHIKSVQAKKVVQALYDLYCK